MVKRSTTIFGALDTLASTLSSHAKVSASAWPMETFPNFEAVVSNFRNITGSRLITTSPLVDDSNIKLSWEAYAVANQGWIKEGLTYIGADTNVPNIPPTIHEFDSNGKTVASVHGPYSPIWQTSQPPSNTSIINYNLLSDAVFSNTFTIAHDLQRGILSQAIDGEIGGIFQAVESFKPESLLVQPIFDNPSSASRQIVASIVAVISWEIYFSGLLHEGVNGMVCVLSNTCGQTFTYTLNGPTASYVGQGDLHDTAYDNMVYVADVTPFITSDSTRGEAICSYTVDIYPSKSLESQYQSPLPGIYMGVMFLVFICAAVIFLTYDYLVQKRQREAMNSAARSNAIVSSLFPAEIRDRLFKGEEQDAQDNTKTDKKLLPTLHEAPQKFRLKNYLNEEEIPNAKKESVKNGADDDSKPIADLFPNTTVMFADIAGFTAWSSVREPSQVFTLLETVYRSFDR